MKIRLNKAHFPVRSLGPGERVGIWFQGCSIRCRGCVSLDTWGLRPETTVDADEVIAWCWSHLAGGSDGLTVSGGEPFDQPEALINILEKLKRLGDASELEFDVLCYTGLHYHEVSQRFGPVLSLLDAIVSEPFEQNLPTQKYLCGSDNQVLRILSEKGRQRFERGGGRMAQEKPMGVSVGDDSVYFTGIPRGKDLEELRGALAARGVKLGKTSWRE